MRHTSFVRLLGSSIVLIGLAACGNTEKPADSASVTTTTETTVAAAAPEATAPADPAAAMPAAATPAAAPAVAYASLTGDAVHGEKIFAQCKTCHVAEMGVNRVGPSLWAVVGRPSGSVPGYTYSAANKNSGLTWTPEQLFTYLEAPQKTIPGTKMAFAGLKNPQDRADVIAYLNTKA